MADFEKSFKILCRLEFGYNPNKALHKNKGEKYLTYMGIYGGVWAGLAFWDKIRRVVSKHNGRLILASNELYADPELMADVKQFYVSKFWRALKCNEIKSQKLADNLFCFAVNVGLKNAIKVLQKMLGIKDDGVIGSQTLGATKLYDEQVLITNFKTAQLAYYENLCVKTPKLAINLNGWKNRVKNT